MPIHEVDIHVGGRIRQRRILLGMSQTNLGQAVGLTFQQVQKYERGYNRVSSSRLYEFAKALDVSVTYFFAEMSSRGRAQSGKSIDGRKGSGRSGLPEDHTDLLMKRETLLLLRAYYKSQENVVRGGITKMIKALAAIDAARK